MLIHQKMCRGSDQFVYIRGKWLNRGYMYIVKISSLVLYMCIYIYIQEVFGPHSGVWNWSSLTESLYRNRHDKKPLEKDVWVAVRSQVLKEAFTRTLRGNEKHKLNFSFPLLQPFYCFKINNNLYRTLKIILKVWNFLWRSLAIDPDIYVMFLSLLQWNKTIILAH